MIEFFPYEKPRDCQSDAFKALQDNWNKYEVFVLRLAVGSGKSGIALTLSRFLNSKGFKSTIGVPNNILRDQYLNEFSDLSTVKAVEEYRLEDYGFIDPMNKHVGDVVKSLKMKGKSKWHQAKRKEAYAFYSKNGNPHQDDLKKAKSKDSLTVANYYSIMAHKLYKNSDVMIFDEAHNLLPTLQDLHTMYLPRSKYGYSEDLNRVEDLYEFIERNKDSDDKKISKLVSTISDRDSNCSISLEDKDVFDKEIVLKPISVKGEPNLLWNNKQKIILMSATIGEEDVRRLNLSGDVCFLDFASPIPASNRPIIPLNSVDMGYNKIDSNLDKAVDEILKIANDNKDSKGFVHATYDLAKKLEELIDDPRFVFMTKDNKRSKFDEFVKSNKPLVFVGSGMAEGIDLKYDKARWQIITKIPFPSLADARNRAILKNDPDYYQWMAAKDLLQMSGRVCRAEDDFGSTFVLDKNYDLWYNKSYKLIPKWFKEGVR